MMPVGGDDLLADLGEVEMFFIGGSVVSESFSPPQPAERSTGGVPRRGHHHGASVVGEHRNPMFGHTATLLVSTPGARG